MAKATTFSVTFQGTTFTRKSATKVYTHVVLGTTPASPSLGVFSWHSSRQLAEKARQTFGGYPLLAGATFHIVEVA